MSKTTLDPQPAPEPSNAEIMKHLNTLESCVFKNEELVNELCNLVKDSNAAIQQLIGKLEPPKQAARTTPNTKENMQIKDLNATSKGVNLTANILKIEPPRTVNTQDGQKTVTEALLGDNTGTVKLSLWDSQISQVKVGDQAKIKNGYISSYKGELKLNIGKYGQLTV